MPDVLSAAGGCSLIEAAMRVALGQIPSNEGLSPCHRLGFRINVQPPMWARRIRSIEGTEALRALPEVQSVTLFRTAGDTVDWHLGTDEMVLALVGAVDDFDALRSIRQRVHEQLSISYE